MVAIRCLNAFSMLFRSSNFSYSIIFRNLHMQPKIPENLSDLLYCTRPLISLNTFGVNDLLSTRQFNASGIISRTNIRNRFPIPRDLQRIRKHGWRKRLSTLSGRMIIMRRILKGRHVLSH